MPCISPGEAERHKKTFKNFRGNDRDPLSTILKVISAGAGRHEGNMRYVRDMRGYGANPPDPKWPGGAHVARAVRRQLRGRRRELRPAWRRRLGSLPVGDRRRRSPGPASATGTWNRSTNTARAPASGGCTACSPRPTCRSPVYGVATALGPLARPGRGDAGGRLGDRLARPEMDRLPRLRDRRRAPRHGRGDPAARRGDRRAADRLVHRPHLGQHGRLAAEEGGFAYVSDTYDDELPYWLDHDGHGHDIRRS